MCLCKELYRPSEAVKCVEACPEVYGSNDLAARGTCSPAPSSWGELSKIKENQCPLVIFTSFAETASKNDGRAVNKKQRYIS